MTNILLLGAGFSRNWGGFLASEASDYLLGCSEILSSKRLQALLWRNQAAGGFENALAEIQADFNDNPEINRNDFINLQNAVSRMFSDMNSGFFETSNFEFQHFKDRTIRTFLTKFDLIFTLNQDLLLEHHYIDHDVNLLSNTRWNGSELPGMRPIPSVTSSWAKRTWVPVAGQDFQLNPRSQPYIKLHGSSNWQQQENQQIPMLIIGGNKSHQIGLFPVLNRYYQLFKERLFQSNVRLMIIGYGFRDTHINDILMKAVDEHGLRMFIIGPDGGDLLEKTFRNSLIGASRRSLREIFGNDKIEFNKVMRFFNV